MYHVLYTYFSNLLKLVEFLKLMLFLPSETSKPSKPEESPKFPKLLGSLKPPKLLENLELLNSQSLLHPLKF